MKLDKLKQFDSKYVVVSGYLNYANKEVKIDEIELLSKEYNHTINPAKLRILINKYLSKNIKEYLSHRPSNWTKVHILDEFNFIIYKTKQSASNQYRIKQKQWERFMNSQWDD